MINEVNTDNHIQGDERLHEYTQTTVRGAVDRFASQITRLEVHLTDENSHKSAGQDKRCMIEARLEGLKPLAVTHHAPHMNQAIQGAADKLEKALDHALGKLSDRR